MFYDAVKKRADEKKMSLAEVARRAKIDPTLPGKWRIVSPSLANAKKVADVLGCTVDDLIREEAQA